MAKVWKPTGCGSSGTFQGNLRAHTELLAKRLNELGIVPGEVIVVKQDDFPGSCYTTLLLFVDEGKEVPALL